MNKLTTILMVCLTLLLVAVAQPALGSNWPQFQKDQVHSGVTNDSAPIADPNTTISWEHDHPIPSGNMSGIDTSPIVYNGSVYAVIAGGNLTKYYLNGTAAGGNWPVNFVTTPSQYDFQNAAPAAGNGYIFVLDTGYEGSPAHDDLYAINATTGAISDSVNVSDSSFQFSTPVTYVEASNGSKFVLFGSVKMTNWTPSEGVYYCYNVTDPTNLTLCWSHSSSTGYYWAGSAVVGDYAVFGNNSGWLISVNYGTGLTVDQVNVSEVYDVDAQEIQSSVTYSAETGRIYFTSKGGYCYALGFNADTGSFITADNWSKSIGHSTSTPAYYNDRIYVGNSTIDYYVPSYEGNLWCLNETNGAEIWNTPVGPVQSSPAVSAFYGPGNEHIYVTTNSPTGGIYCVDSSGDVAWSEISSGSNCYSLAGAAISGGWVFYGNDDGYLHGRANYTRYDFNGSTHFNGSTGMWAYKYQVEGVPSNKNEPNEEFTSDEYNAIKADDSEFATATADDGNNASHRFVFKIDDNEKPWITFINVTWNGEAHRTDGTDGATLYIWNNTTPTHYEELASTIASADTLSGGKTLDISNYIDDSNNVTVLVVQNDKSGNDNPSEVRTDYVKLVATP
jgi:outer membrane protein assembly factor BamB